MRREFSNAVKAAAALRANGHCEQCTRRLTAGDFHYDHDIPDGLGGEPTLDNCRVLCRSCHSVKTAKHDVPRIAKAKRNFRTSHGIRKASRFQTARTGPFKQKMSGEIVRR
jgi:5-methylcytosine-specific restriction endonuclease McrA